ncbi:hypothetical protein OHA25_48785 [Nonomuraea sp. NBC_00507]|uniref:hypothetical protein n=1 Tax=Nonomuraea sp. NBC_00507 TaxID=2976002 RepID=UPI002E16EAC6
MTVDHRFGQGVGEARKNRLLGTASEVVTDPVTDWATDFSHVDPVWAAGPYPIQDELRQRCPIAHTERFGGVWLPTRYKDVAAVAYDTERFSSRSIIVSNNKPPLDLAPVGDAPPITSDPPFHRDARQLLLPMFTKAAVAEQEEATRAGRASASSSRTSWRASTSRPRNGSHAKTNWPVTSSRRSTSTWPGRATI